MSEEKLETIVSEYADLAKDKNIDVASLMLNALQQEEDNKVNSKTKRWLYLISLSVPPVGILIGLYYWFSDKSDGKQVAYWCAGLTLISLLGSIILFGTVFKSARVSPAQIEQIKPADIYQLTQ